MRGVKISQERCCGVCTTKRVNAAHEADAKDGADNSLARRDGNADPGEEVKRKGHGGDGDEGRESVERRDSGSDGEHDAFGGGEGSEGDGDGADEGEVGVGQARQPAGEDAGGIGDAVGAEGVGAIEAGNEQAGPENFVAREDAHGEAGEDKGEGFVKQAGTGGRGEGGRDPAGDDLSEQGEILFCMARGESDAHDASDDGLGRGDGSVWQRSWQLRSGLTDGDRGQNREGQVVCQRGEGVDAGLALEDGTESEGKGTGDGGGAEGDDACGDGGTEALAESSAPRL